MIDDVTLSPLGGLYLDHIEDIKAGAAAFRADVAAVLGVIAEDASNGGPDAVESSVDCVAKTLQSNLAVMPIVLRLRWGDVWPNFTGSDAAKDMPAAPNPLKDLFPPEFRAALSLPEVDRVALRRSAGTHLRKLWGEAESAVVDFMNRPAFHEREAAVRLMRAVSSQVINGLRGPVFGTSTRIEREPGHTKAEGKAFPCFVQWFLTLKQLSRHVPCDLTYTPSNPEKAVAPSLKLILWGAGNIPSVVEMSLPERVEKAPVVGDYSDRLNAYLDRTDLVEDAEVVEIAAQIAREVLERYEAVVRRVNG